MTTINEADVIRIIQQNPRLVFDAMREDPELQKEVRQAILTDELLELPRQFAKMSDILETQVRIVSKMDGRVERVETKVDNTDARLERVETKVDNTDARLERVETKVDNTDARLERVETKVDNTDARLERVETKVDNTDARLERVETKVDNTDGRLERVESMVERIPPLEARMDRVEALLGYLVGSELERKMGTFVPNRLEAAYEVDDIHILVYQDRHPAVDRDFLRAIDRARGNAVIDDMEHRRLRSADMIVRANRGGGEVFFTVEASSTVDEDDVDRAVQSALALEKVADGEVIPVAIGYAIPSDVREYNAVEKGGRARIFEMRRRNR